MEIRIVIRPVKRAKLLFFLFFLSLNVVAQIDTLIVRGKVENLSLTLYQQAPNISITRVNILQPNREIVRVVQLQPDGSFELKMPLVYPKEECRLYYAHHSVSFLGENGLVEIILYGDSLTKSDTPFKFRGRNAHTNNRHALWEANFSKWLKTNPEKPEKSKDALSFWENTLVEQNRRIAFYQQFATSNDLLLTTWVLSSLQEAAKAHFFAYLAQEKAPLPLNLPTLAPLDTTLLLTFAKADCYYQFTQHATATVPSITNGALPIEMLARLILQYVLHLSEDDHQKLTDIAAGKRAKMTDLKWLNGLFKKKKKS
ncbi:MAG: hypothetical protein R2822_00720 [Spirosomataceae bacterium]